MMSSVKESVPGALNASLSEEGKSQEQIVEILRCAIMLSDTLCSYSFAFKEHMYASGSYFLSLSERSER